MWVTVGLSAGTLVGMAFILTYILGWANKAFHVEVDPRIDSILDALPGANCGNCGYIGCGEYAEAVVIQNADVNLCPVGGANCAAQVADVMGVSLDESLPYRPIIHCGAYYEDRLLRSEYVGEARCVAANLVAGVQGCTYGCTGFGDCVRVCDYDALHVIDGLATVDYDKCIGCGACAKVCPRNIITITPFKSEQILAVTCSNKDTGKEVMRVCKVGCIGCKACSRVSDIFTMDENLSTIDYEKYGPECTLELQQACDKCKRDRLVFVGKPSDKDVEAAADEAAPSVVVPDFKTTVDDTEWRG
jgi:H+/Na+-translocating ferredoxin:NAD+ oxidoreductase subunit B